LTFLKSLWEKLILSIKEPLEIIDAFMTEQPHSSRNYENEEEGSFIYILVYYKTTRDLLDS